MIVWLASLSGVAGPTLPTTFPKASYQRASTTTFFGKEDQSTTAAKSMLRGKEFRSGPAVVLLAGAYWKKPGVGAVRAGGLPGGSEKADSAGPATRGGNGSGAKNSTGAEGGRNWSS